MAYREVPNNRYNNRSGLRVTPHPTRSAEPTLWHRYEQLPLYGKFLFIGSLITIILLLAAIPVHAGDGEDACFIIGGILGGVTAFMFVPGMCEFDAERYKRRLTQAAVTHGLPSGRTTYEAVAIGDQVQIWQGDREEGWKHLGSFHAEDEHEQAMEYWNEVTSKAEAAGASVEAAALAKSLNRG